jgi:hypothetical protein
MADIVFVVTNGRDVFGRYSLRILAEAPVILVESRPLPSKSFEAYYSLFIKRFDAI